MPNLWMSKPYTAEDIHNSPSRGDGMSEVLENEYRRKTCLFIKAAGKALELPIEAVATALVYFHKFFMLHSFQKHERFFVGSACLFLAAKVEESPKRVELVMAKCWAVWHGREPPGEQEKAFKRLREKILIVERCLLHTLGFQLTVEHPYSAVMGLLKRLFNLGRGADGGKGADRALNRQLSQAATSFVNDSLLTTVCVQYRPDEVAAAVVYLSYLYMGLPRVDTTLLGAEHTVVADICDAILLLYDENGSDHATNVANELRSKVNQRIQASPSPAAAAASAANSPATMPSPRPTPSPRMASSPKVVAADASLASSASPRVSNGTTGPDGGARTERKRSGSDDGHPRTGRSGEEEKRHRDPRGSPSRGKSPKKRKSAEESDREVAERERETADNKRQRSL